MSVFIISDLHLGSEFCRHEKIQEFKTIAEANYSKFEAIGGPDAKLVKEALLKDIADAKKTLGITE